MILVTGGAGFIGAHTVRALCTDGAAVRVLDDLSTGRRERLEGLDAELVVGSVEDAATVEAALDGVDAVIHLAARVSVPGSWDDPSAYVRTNVEAFATLLAAARAAGVRRVVYASSCAVYGSHAPQPVSEGAPLAPESPYAATKACDEALAAAFAAQGPSALGLRYFNVFGPGQDPHGAYGAVIPTFVSRALAGLPLEVHGDGRQGRDFVSVRDVARANVLAVRSTARGVLNVGTGRRTTVGELAARVAALLPEVRIEGGPARVGDVRDSLADTRAAAASLGFSAEAPFETALDETLRWFAEGADQRRLASASR